MRFVVICAIKNDVGMESKVTGILFDLSLSEKPLLVSQSLSRDPDKMGEQLFKLSWEKHSRQKECHVQRPEVKMCS